MTIYKSLLWEKTPKPPIPKFFLREKRHEMREKIFYQAERKNYP